ncbi:energy transducer TonB [Campylobacter lari]|uniref:Energy transduction protein TonB n=1 Tax=Campylobacter lari (strain RM2100 / D67 / ATCC BAA-1060) TaxID=306263 RepID=B9KFH9_CAMLR|nr:energy transducer TonB [Campylobacter lari]ACM63814.1 energy transduction protein TonB [Campylobacter lari RM2100]EAH7188284.1 energy transducer TonB [Campylobacter lari]EAI4828363.1 energy transducer TonB [Campylobacter lari]EAI7269683.1 energy transducer TonB [Campylobacter lari]EAJ0337673.1 energy transducer TonB [Campylobacter lari]
MKTFINNHKNQSFFITLFLFLPLFFVFIYTNNFLHIQHSTSKEEKFNIAIKQFLQDSPKVKTKQPKQEKIKKPEQTKEKAIMQPKKTNILTNTNTINQLNEKIKPQKTITQEKNTPITSQESIFLTNNNEFLKEVKQAIDEVLIYPRQAKKMRMSGEILVEFTWTKDKNLLNLKILKPSKYKLLNDSALETIRIASKNFPQYEKTFHIRIPLIYKIN